MKLLEKVIYIKSITDPVTLIPFGCVHRDDPGVRRHLFEQCIQEIIDTPNCLAIGMGDYANFLRTTARKHLESYVSDENSFDDLASMVKGEAILFHTRYLKRIQDKLIGLAEGNHYYKFQNSTTDTQFLCDLAKTPYLDKPAFIRLVIRYGSPNNSTTVATLTMLVHHGDWSAGTSRLSGDVSSLDNKSQGFGDFDIFLAGHTHRLWAVHTPTLQLSKRGELELRERPRVFIRTGCFVSGYDSKCVASYAHKKLLPPTELGYCRLRIKLYREYNADRAAQSEGSSRYNGYKHKFSVEY